MNLVAVNPEATLGSRMPPHGSFQDQLADLRRELAEEKKERKELEDKIIPIVDFYNASTLLGKILWVLGAMAGVAATVWAATRK